MMKNRTVIVSNRVQVPTSNQSSGGLVVVLKDSLKQGDIWFGGSGDLVNSEALSTHDSIVDGVRYTTMDLTSEEHNGYYNNYANGVLWQVFHDLPENAQYNRKDQRIYQNVNAKYATAMLSFLKNDDAIFVNDYHFFHLASCLRKRNVKNKIGFFLHIPFPHKSILAKIPHVDDMINDALSYDLIGFQTHQDKKNFQEAVLEMTTARLVSEDTLEVQEGFFITEKRLVKLGVFNVEINALEVQTSAKENMAKTEDYRKRLDGRKMIFGVDRLDVSKGLLERMNGYKTFLENHPEQHGQVVMTQVSQISRQDVPVYRKLKKDLDNSVMDINTSFGDLNWQPIAYSQKALPRDTCLSYLRMADVCLITSLKDGMNLVAKEFVASQDPENPGVLILSKFAGASEQLQDALLVNPKDADQVSQMIEKALMMSLEERKTRYQSMWEIVSRHNSAEFFRSFMMKLTDNRIPTEETPMVYQNPGFGIGQRNLAFQTI